MVRLFNQDINWNNTNIPHDIIDKDIISISNYDLRNRKTETTNPFFIIKSKKFRLGVLTVNTSEDNGKEQLLFITNLIKLPLNNNLI